MRKAMAEQQTQLNNDGILVMDETGEFKLLVGGELKPYQGAGEQESVGAYQSAEPVVKTNLPMDTGLEERMLQPPPPMVRSQSASFYFHPADEEEAAIHQGAAALSRGQKRYSLDKILDKIIANYQLQQLASELKNRLRMIVFNFLRDRRSLIDTAGILARPETEAGLNLSQTTAGSLAEFLKEIKQKISGSGGIVVNEQITAAAKSVPVKPVVNEVKMSAPVPIPPLPKTETGGFIPVSSPLKSATTPSLRKTTEAILPKMQRLPKSGINQLTDVKKDYKLVGPLEELLNLNLETFHRLGLNTAERIKKILSKINLLAAESLAKKAAGIKAWQQSPLAKMYVALGQASMEHGLSIDKIITEYNAGGREIITVEEFEAISDLNRQLRF